LRPIHYSYGLLDAAICRAEKIVEWCAPDLSPKKGGQQLEKPMPWLFFLPTLLMIRVIRFNLSAISYLSGGDRVSTGDMVIHFTTLYFQILNLITVLDQLAQKLPNLHSWSTIGGH
jgi:hypothetical protein